jgi:hypothetical protein
MGGSTNTILHLLAIAQEAEIDFTMADIDRLSRIVPQLCKVAPNTNKYHIEDVHRAGGIMAILGELDRAGKLHTDVPTVHSKTMKDALDQWDIARNPSRRGQTFYMAGPGGIPTQVAFSQSTRWPSLDRPRRRLHPLGGACLLARRRPGRADRQHRAGRLRGQDRRRGRVHPGVRRPGPRGRVAGRSGGQHPGRQGQGRRRGDRALRRPQGRPRHAGNALPHQLHQVQGPGQGLRAADRRPLLGRHLGPVHRPLLARSGGRRRHRPGAQRRPHPHRHPQPPHQRAGVGRAELAAAAPSRTPRAGSPRSHARARCRPRSRPTPSW